MAMLVPTLLLSSLCLLCLSLSDPGAPWTEEEALIVKGKIYSLMDKSVKKTKEYLALHKKEIGLKEWPESFSIPDAPKFIRLGFHQCLKNSDGTGGCNGCLNNHGKCSSKNDCVLYNVI